jgi:hypothetical protein
MLRVDLAKKVAATPGEKINMGPLWDFDLSFGNVDYAGNEFPFPEGFWIISNPW